MSQYSFVTGMDRRQAWSGILLLIVVYFVGDRGLGVVLDQAILGTKFRYSTLYAGSVDADVLVLGNSRGVNSFYTPQLNKRLKRRCFNLAYNGMSPDVALALFQDYLERHNAPQLLILEGTCVDNNSMCVVNLKPYWRHSSRLTAIADRVAPRSVAASRLSRLFDYNCELFFRALSYRRSNDQSWINRYSIDEQLVQLTKAMPPVDMHEVTTEQARSLRCAARCSVRTRCRIACRDRSVPARLSCQTGEFRAVEGQFAGGAARSGNPRSLVGIDRYRLLCRSVAHESTREHGNSGRAAAMRYVRFATLIKSEPPPAYPRTCAPHLRGTLVRSGCRSDWQHGVGAAA